jgi:hypothetical protein
MSFEQPIENYSPEPIENKEEKKKIVFPLDLETVLSNLPLPNYYKTVGIKERGDETMSYIDVWQSKESMQEEEPGYHLARIMIDKLNQTVHVNIDGIHSLEPHLIMSSLELETLGKSESETQELLKARLEQNAKTGEKSDITLIRDPRIQAVINYVANLQQEGFSLECDEENAKDRKVAMAVIDKLLTSLNMPEKKESSSEEEALMSGADIEVLKKRQELESTLAYLKKTDEEAQEKALLQAEQSKNIISNQPKRNRRTTDPEV